MLTNKNAVPFIPVPFIGREIDLTEREDGTIIARNRMPLKELDRHLPAIFERAMRRNPDRTWLAQRRGPQKEWYKVSYSEGKRLIDGVTQALLDLGKVGRPVVILSGNSVEHALISMAAMQARMPAAPITPAYSLRSNDFAKLRAIIELLEPAVVFVQDMQEYQRALGIFDLSQVEIIYVDNPIEGLGGRQFYDVANTEPTPAVEQSVAAITHDTVGKYMFTSGSTNEPKAVITTQRMLCANIAMNDQAIDLELDNPPHVTVDWLPWNHVMGGNSVFGMTLQKGGTLYIDDGKPTPELFAETLRNLREISTTRFANVPFGFAMLAEAMEKDPELAKTFFKTLTFIGYGGSRLADDTYNRIQALAVKYTGHKISFLSGFGATETGPSAMYVFWSTDHTGLIGLPLPGAIVKLIPIDGERYEVRVKSPGITPGYLKRPDLTAAAFDEEGFFKMGDAATYVDKDNPEEGFVFAGRVSEEFKLQSGIFVRVGALRVKAVDALAPMAIDAVVAGQDQQHVGLLVWLNLGVCRDMLGQPKASMAEVIASPAIRERVSERLAAYNAANPGNSNQVKRVVLMEAPLSMDAGEITDKGYVNQRKALQTRAASVEMLFQDPPPADVIVL